MDVLWNRQLGFQLMDTPEEIVMVEKVIPHHIDHSQKLLGKKADDLEPGLLFGANPMSPATRATVSWSVGSGGITMPRIRSILLAGQNSA